MSEISNNHSSVSARSAVPGTLGATGSSTASSVIGPTVVVRGQISAAEDLLVRGRVEGTIEHDQTLTIHSEGIVEAVVRAKEVHIHGSVQGDVFGTERIRVCATGAVTGNVVSPRVSLEEGSRFKGMVDMDTDAAAIDRRYAERSGGGVGRSGAAAANTESETSTKESIEAANGDDSGKNGSSPRAAKALKEKVSANAETPARDDQSGDAKAAGTRDERIEDD